MSTRTQSKIDVPADSRLPSARQLLDSAQAALLLAGHLPNVDIGRLRELSYIPGGELWVRYRARRDDGTPTIAVAHLHANPAGERLRAWTWPADPALKALPRYTEQGWRETLAYRPLDRAVLRIDEDTVLKAYGSARAHQRAAWGLGRSNDLPILTPKAFANDADLRACSQEYLVGTDMAIRTHSHGAGDAGAMAASIHRASPKGAPVVDNRTLLIRALRPAHLAATAAPWLADRLGAVTRQLAATMPADGQPVLSHGDFTFDQLRETGRGTALLDFDTLCAAAPGHDLGTFAANLISGRSDDLPLARHALEEMVEVYGTRPSSLDWYFAVALLRRVDRPVRRAKRNWVDRCEAIVASLEEVSP